MNSIIKIMSEADSVSPEHKLLRIAIVGPCSAGKTTLGKTLKEAGFTVRQPAQEHSLAPDMWRRLSRPDVLIYLDVDYENTLLRRPHQDGGPQRVTDQNKRLAHARKHCDLYIDTNGLTLEEVRAKALAFLEDNRVITQLPSYPITNYLFPNNRPKTPVPDIFSFRAVSILRPAGKSCRRKACWLARADSS